ncbi:MAG: aminotransferase class IV [Halobacteriovoraceae bacterium]|nr:aminotransferase class IV [Halobacteriovoraceae bacterium]MCB9095647.1 aminotransferase class IV [Halobacteriovoraceae bacterium]
MKRHFYWKNELISQSPLINLDNKSFLYGESIFTTFLMSCGKLSFLNWHLERLQKGAEVFLFATSQEAALLKTLFEKFLVQLENFSFSSSFQRIRVSCYRDPENFQALKLWAEIEEKDQGDFFINDSLEHLRVQSLKFALSESERASDWRGADYKVMGNYAQLFHCRHQVQARGFDDVLFCNSENSVYELSTSNLCVFENGEFIFPLSKHLLVNGIQQRFLKESLGSQFPIVERPIDLDYLFGRPLAVLSLNCVKGLGLIEEIDGKAINYDQQFDNVLKLFKEKYKSSYKNLRLWKNN